MALKHMYGALLLFLNAYLFAKKKKQNKKKQTKL